MIVPEYRVGEGCWNVYSMRCSLLRLAEAEGVCGCPRVITQCRTRPQTLMAFWSLDSCYEYLIVNIQKSQEPVAEHTLVINDRHGRRRGCSCRYGVSVRTAFRTKRVNNCSLTYGASYVFGGHLTPTPVYLREDMLENDASRSSREGSTLWKHVFTICKIFWRITVGWNLGIISKYNNKRRERDIHLEIF